MTTHLRRMQRIWCAIIVLAVCIAVTVLSSGTVRAYADENTDAPSASATTSETDTDGTDTSVTSDDSTVDTQRVSIALDAATPVVTETSGYELRATITNHSGHTIDAGMLDLTTNPAYTFISYTDFEQWATGVSPIMTPNELGNASVERLDNGKSVAITIHVDADNDVLQAITTWGPKPLLVTYSVDEEAVASVCTFLTRSQDGLHAAQTPDLHISVAMPLTSTAHSVDDAAISKLARARADDSQSATTLASTIAQPTNAATQQLQSVAQLAQDHAALQLVADPIVVSSVSNVNISNIMQPAAFDITMYANATSSDQTDENTAITAKSYTSAGVKRASWNAASAQTQARSALTNASNNANSINTFAWQGNSVWTQEALDTAAQQGYNTVIATHGFNASDDGTNAHTDVYSVPTDDGTVTVLAAQPILTTLAQGYATDSDALAETSTAGRIARFMAQSAFYQMQQPYTNRYVFVCLSANTNTQETASLLNAIEGASWLDPVSLDTLANATPYMSGSTARSAVPTLDDAIDTSAIAQVLTNLKASRDDITRFKTSILTEADTTSTEDATDSSTTAPSESSSSSSSSASSTASSNATNGSSASSTTQPTADPSAWVKKLYAVHDRLALLALASPLIVNHNDLATDTAADDDTVSTTDSAAESVTDVDATASTSAAADTTDESASANKTATISDSAAEQFTTHAQTLEQAATKLSTALFDNFTLTVPTEITVVSETASLQVSIANKLPYAVDIKVGSLTDSMEIVTSRAADVLLSPQGETQATLTIRVSTSGTTVDNIQLMDRNGQAFGQLKTTTITSGLQISDKSGWVFIAIAIALGVLGLWRQFNRKKDPNE